MICIDASVVIKLILDEEQSDLAKALYRSTLQAGEAIVAPPLMPIEATNILRQRLRRPDGPSRDEATALLDQLLAFSIAIHDPEGLHRRALVLADDYGLPAAYDAHYLALAEFMRCDFWTADERLMRQLGGRLRFVHGIGDHAP